MGLNPITFLCAVFPDARILGLSVNALIVMLIRDVKYPSLNSIAAFCSSIAKRNLSFKRTLLFSGQVYPEGLWTTSGVRSPASSRP